ncbi:MAG TPA: hypothetical protein VGO16_03645 [Pseudonocardiaceae bacterium]|nr:hypothetical protein [Pseudonocardiaceae bacterium]
MSDCASDSRVAVWIALRRTPRRWALSPYDQRSHLLAERGPDQVGIQVAVCGQRMRWPVDTSAQPTGRRCLTCEALGIGSGPCVQLPLTTVEAVYAPAPS